MLFSWCVSCSILNLSRGFYCLSRFLLFDTIFHCLYGIGWRIGYISCWNWWGFGDWRWWYFWWWGWRPWRCMFLLLLLLLLLRFHLMVVITFIHISFCDLNGKISQSSWHIPFWITCKILNEFVVRFKDHWTSEIVQSKNLSNFELCLKYFLLWSSGCVMYVTNYDLFWMLQETHQLKSIILI